MNYSLNSLKGVVMGFVVEGLGSKALKEGLYRGLNGRLL